jgi:DNA-binding GntR family transcriptional regulator
MYTLDRNRKSDDDDERGFMAYARAQAGGEGTVMSLKPATAQTLGQSVHDRLKAMILAGELPAGTPLQEKLFAERLGVSRTPVREAVAKLTSEGLVTRNGGGVPTVSRISVTEIMEILHVRRLLEGETARQAASVNASPEPFLALRRRLTQYLEGERPSVAEYAQFDEDFHTLVARTAGSTLLTDLVKGLKLKTRIFDNGSIPERFVPGCHEHIEIVDAILARDPPRAEAAMLRHIDNARNAILGHLSRLF